jgi:anti-sigma factor RsiW
VRCRQVQFRLSAFLDNELPDPVRASLRTHLGTCPACRRALTRLERLAGVLVDGVLSPVPEGLAERILARGRQSAGPVVSRSQPRPAVAHLRRVAAVFVFAAGLAAGTWMAWGLSSPPTGTAREPAAAPADPVATYNLDYLGGQPKESLPQVYLTLLPATDRPGEQPSRRP